MNSSDAATNLPNGWSKRRLFDLCQFIPGKAHEPFIDPLGEFICVNSKFISTEGEVAKTCNQNITPARTDDVLLVMSDLPNGRALAKCYLVEQDELYAVNQRVCILRPRTGADPKMLFHVLNRNPYFLAFNDGVNQTHLLNSVFEKCELAVPDESEEQTRIGSALSDADALIEGLEQLIAKKRLIKQGAMQDLLTAKRRLPGFSGEWETKRLAEIGQVKTGLTYSPTDVSPYGTLVLRSSNIQQDRLAFDNNVYVNLDVSDEATVRIGDLLICVRNGSRQLIGKTAIIDDRADGMAFGAFMSAFRSDLNAYLIWCFQSSVIQKQVAEHLGATINQITNKTLKAIEVPIPADADERIAISSVISDMDAEIQALETRLEKARQVKEGMMQNLLTGRIRLV